MSLNGTKPSPEFLVMAERVRKRAAAPTCSDGTKAEYDDGCDCYKCSGTGEVGPNGPIDVPPGTQVSETGKGAAKTPTQAELKKMTVAQLQKLVYANAGVGTATSTSSQIANAAQSELQRRGKAAGYGRTLAGDPRWMKAKYPGVDAQGKSFERGAEVLYWPSTKTFMTGDEAKTAWRKFQSEKGDEEGMPYARSASVERVAGKFAARMAIADLKGISVDALHELTAASKSLAEAMKLLKKGDVAGSVGHLNFVDNAVGGTLDDIKKAL